jgi:hypothetical protein
MTSLLSNSRALDLSRIISGHWPPCTTVTRPPARVSAWACPELATDLRDATAIVARQEQGVLA